MTDFKIDTLWIPLFPGEKEGAIRLLVRNGLTLASWLGAQLEWLVPGNAPSVARHWVNRACSEAERTRQARCSVVPISRPFGPEVLRQLSAQAGGLLLMSADRAGIFGFSHGLSPGKALLLEHCALPVWIVPAGLRMMSEPVRSVLVPMSGEKRASQALDLAIQLGNQHGIPVDILHVTSSIPKRECDESVLGNITDQFHHEYPGLVEELIVQGSPYSGPRERQVIRSFCHRYGDVAHELRGRIRKSGESLLVFEWKGSLKKGKARKIKLLLRRASGPILLIREDGKARSWLKIGREFGATG